MELLKAAVFIIFFSIFWTGAIFFIFLLVQKFGKLPKRKKGKGIYDIPIKLYFLSTIIWGIPILIVVMAIMFIPTWLYVHSLGILGDAYKMERRIIFGLVWVIFFYYFVIKRPRWKWLLKLEDYPLRRWVLSNVRCPECGNLFKKCKRDRSCLGEPLLRDMPRYSCYCKHCRKEVRIPSKGIDLQ